MIERIKESSLADFSARLASHAGLEDHEIRWYDSVTSRRVRSDLTIERLHLVDKNLPPPTDKTAVATYLKDAHAMVRAGLKPTARPYFYSPDGSRIDGHTLISRLYKLEQTQVQKDVARAWELVLQVSDEANESLDVRQSNELHKTLCKIVPDFDDNLRSALSRLKKRAIALKGD